MDYFNSTSLSAGSDSLAREVVAKDWELSSCTISHMTLSCDARVVREDTAGEFLKALTSLLGEPEKLFSNS